MYSKDSISTILSNLYLQNKTNEFLVTTCLLE